jgi:YD repeat-containing protein
VTLPNGVVTTTGYDTSLGYLNSLTNVAGGGTHLSDWSYQEDLAGRITTDTHVNVRTRAYTYDNAGRLTQTVEGATTRLYAYDANTNRCALGSSCPTSNPAWTYDEADRITKSPQATSYSYDAQSGELLSATRTDGKTEVITYDANHHAKTINDGTTTVTETLAPSGRVIRRVVTATAGGLVLEDVKYGYDDASDSPAYSIREDPKTTVVLVVANPSSLTALDTNLKTLLEQLGHTVTVISHTAAEPAASTYGLAVISESVSSTSVGTKFKSTAKPVLINDAYILDDHDLASSPQGMVSNTTAFIADANHPAANGLPAGSVTTHTSSSSQNLGRANGVDSDAQVYLKANSTGYPSGFTVDAGTTVLNSDVTDGPRAFFGPANPTSGNNWTAATSGMFQALVTQLLGGPGGTDTYLGVFTDRAGVATWHLANGHGDIVGTTDTAGSFTAVPATDEFGVGTAPASRLGWLGDKQRYTTSPSLGLIRMGVRLYDPTLGRFLEVDPVGRSRRDDEPRRVERTNTPPSRSASAVTRTPAY